MLVQTLSSYKLPNSKPVKVPGNKQVDGVFQYNRYRGADRYIAHGRRPMRDNLKDMWGMMKTLKLEKDDKVQKVSYVGLPASFKAQIPKEKPVFEEKTEKEIEDIVRETLEKPSSEAWSFPLHFPGYSYLGPGTTDMNAVPINALDEIARRHDLAYSRSNGDRDAIREADEAMVREIDEMTPEQNQTLGWTGHIAKRMARNVISAKIRLEGITGTTFYSGGSTDQGQGAAATSTLAPGMVAPLPESDPSESKVPSREELREKRSAFIMYERLKRVDPEAGWQELQERHRRAWSDNYDRYRREVHAITGSSSKAYDMAHYLVGLNDNSKAEKHIEKLRTEQKRKDMEKIGKRMASRIPTVQPTDPDRERASSPNHDEL